MALAALAFRWVPLGEDMREDAACTPRACALDGSAAPKLSPEALYERAELAYWLGDFDVAIADLEAAYAASHEPLLLYDLGLARLRRHEISGERCDLLRARVLLRNFRARARDLDEELAENVAQLIDLVDEELAREPAPRPGS